LVNGTPSGLLHSLNLANEGILTTNLQDLFQGFNEFVVPLVMLLIDVAASRTTAAAPRSEQVLVVTRTGLSMFSKA
jgi:hypothetical protein